MDRKIVGKFSAACGWLCLLCAVIPSTASSWSQATHAHIADRIGARIGLDNLGEMWGIVEPDLAIFIRLRNDVDPQLGRKLARAGRGETKALSGLLAKAFAVEYAAACPDVGGDEATAASVLVDAEEQHRKNMIFLGQAISQTEPVAVQLLAGQVTALLPLLGVHPDPDRAVEVVGAAIVAAMTVCLDYAAEIEATTEFVAQNLLDRGIGD